ncbi:MAG: hypothetical protein D3926_03020 [Desulfobacteraceae bacterium]|nr:MAG: hypothetical protein D3926_03020 [Desulfobacteraceae bacterium]
MLARLFRNASDADHSRVSRHRLDMRKLNTFWWFCSICTGAALLTVSVILFTVWQQLSPDQARIVMEIITAYPGYFFCAVFLALFILGFALDAISNLYVRPVKRISEQARIIYSSNPSHRIPMEGNRDIRSMVSVINDFADMFEHLSKDITQQILQAKTQLEKDKNLLAAIMAEMPEGVVICNTKGRILLFNNMAQKILGESTQHQSQEYFIGLGRSVYHLIDRILVEHSLSVVKEKLEQNHPNAVSYFLAPTRNRLLIRSETLPVLDSDNRMTGFILTFKETSRKIDHFHQISGMLYAFQNQLSLHDNLSGNYGTLRMDILDKCISWLPLSALSAGKLAQFCQNQLEDNPDIELVVSGSSMQRRFFGDLYSLGVVICKIVELSCEKSSLDQKGQCRFALDFEAADDQIQIIIRNQSDPMLMSTTKMYEKINSLPSLEYLLKLNQAHWAVVLLQETGRQQFTITLKAETQSDLPKHFRSPVITVGRPEFYDFDLFQAGDGSESLMNMDLNKIRYTVFDTETTGLNPEKDEILSIGAVRIINGRIQYRDEFEALINPQRSIPMESYKIHGISYEMVEEKPLINEVLPRFKKFVGDTVLVGHNIAFDMKMLKVKENSTHISFTNPVLDTLLLSASLHPVETQHDMESIAQRLGIEIIGRHTAMGDAIATAQIYLKLIRILNSSGIFTLKNALEASRKTYYARLSY